MSIHFGQRKAEPDGVWEDFVWTAKTGGDVSVPFRIRELSTSLFESLRKPFLKVKRRGVRVTEEIPKNKQKAADRALLEHCIAGWRGITADFCTETGKMLVGAKDVSEYKLPAELVVIEAASTETREIPCDNPFIKYYIVDKLGGGLEAGDNPTSDILDFAQELAASISVVADEEEVQEALGNSGRSPSSSSDTPSSTAGGDRSATPAAKRKAKALA